MFDINYMDYYMFFSTESVLKVKIKMICKKLELRMKMIVIFNIPIRNELNKCFHLIQLSYFNLFSLTLFQNNF